MKINYQKRSEKMRMYFALVVILLVILASKIKAEGFDHFEYVKKYTKCEAIQNVAANISSQSEEEFFQHELHFSSLDSRVIAMEFARAGKYQEADVEELYAAYLSEYKEVISKTEDVQVFLSSLQPDVKKCKQLNEMQKDILQRK